MKKRTAILISGRGSNMTALIKAAKEPDYPAEISLVLSNRPDAPGLTLARDTGIPAIGLDHRQAASREDFDQVLSNVLVEHDIELIACAGYMRIFSSSFTKTWNGRLINIHPSLLPSFKGLDTHQRALEAGVKIHGCTVHYVIPDLDAGPIIGQAAVPVFPNDDESTLSTRVLHCEHKLYPNALALVASGRADLQHGRVKSITFVEEASPLFSPALPS